MPLEKWLEPVWDDGGRADAHSGYVRWPNRYMRAAPNPRTFTGWFGASPHVLRFPCGLSSSFPSVCPPGFLPFARLLLVTLRPAFSGSVPSAVAVQSVPPSVSLRVPFPSATLTVALAPGGSVGVGPARAGLRSPVPAGFLAPIARQQRRHARDRATAARRMSRMSWPGRYPASAAGPEPARSRGTG